MKSNIDTLNEITERLPEFASDCLYSRAMQREVTTRIGYARDFEAFLSWILCNHPDFAEKSIKEIAEADMGKIGPIWIDRYLSYYEQSHSEYATARAKVAISSFYKYLVDTLEMPYKNPCAGAGKVTIPKKDFVIYLTQQEQQTLLNCIRYGTGLTKKQLTYHERLVKRDLAMIVLFLDTGIRLSELVSLNIGDIVYENCSMIITRKRKRISEIYFSDECAYYLKDYLEERLVVAPFTSTVLDPLFITMEGQRLSPRGVEKTVEKYTKTALPNRKGISPHKLRSSFAMGFYGTTKDILTLQEKMGHDSLNTTNVYVKAASSKSKETRNWKI